MTFTRLTLGEPRLKGRPKGGPQGPGGCSEDLQVGQVLTDSGFENQSTLFGYTGQLPKFIALALGGPRQDLTGGGEIHPPDKPAHFSPSSTTSGQTHNSVLSQANPRSGSWHIRQTCSVGPPSVGYTQLAERWSCGPHDTGGGDQPWTARVAEGVTIDASVWATTPSLSHGFRFNFQLWEQDFSFHSNNQSPTFSWTAINTYEQFQYSLVVPALAFWLACRLAPQTVSDNVVFDMDDASVSISL